MHFEGDRTYKREESTSKPATPATPDAPPAHEREMQELMLELRAAQSSKA
jgi:hypothetical protein